MVSKLLVSLKRDFFHESKEQFQYGALVGFVEALLAVRESSATGASLAASMGGLSM